MNHSELQKLADKCRDKGESLIIGDDRTWTIDDTLDLTGIKTVSIAGRIRYRGRGVAVMLGVVGQDIVLRPNWCIDVFRYQGGYAFNDDSVGIQIDGMRSGIADVATAGFGVGCRIKSQRYDAPVTYSRFCHRRHSWCRACVQIQTVGDGWANQCQHYGGIFSGSTTGDTRTEAAIECDVVSTGGFGAHGHVFYAPSFEGDMASVIRCVGNANNAIKVQDARIELRPSGLCKVLDWGESDSQLSFHALTSMNHVNVDAYGVETQSWVDPRPEQ